MNVAIDEFVVNFETLEGRDERAEVLVSRNFDPLVPIFQEIDQGFR